MAQPQTIFRFITVRNPRKPTKDEIETGFAKYDSAIKAPLVEKVIAAQAQGPRAVREAIAAFIKGKDYVRTTLELDEKFGAQVDFGDWLMRRGGAITPDELKRKLGETPFAAGVEAARVLWDNLVAQTFGGGVSEVREGVINALRALNVKASREALLADPAAVKRIATATVVIPSAAKVPAVREHEPKPDDKPNPTEERKKNLASAWKDLEQHEAAYTELSSYYQAAVQEARAQPSPPPPIPRMSREPKCGVSYPDDDAGAEDLRIGRIDAALHHQLSEGTRAVLAKLRLPATASIPYALDQIHALSQKVAAKVAADPKGARSVVQVGGAFWMTGAAPHAHAMKAPSPAYGRRDIEYDNFFPYDDKLDVAPDCQIKPLGVADYRRVEQEICCYEPGEVAHIENVLKGESKERVTRHLMRTEETFTTSSSEETTSERDTQTTDRFELEKESEKTIQEDIKFDLGVNVQASYGVVKITADAKFGYAHSTKESDKSASKYAKDVTDRSLERVVKRIEEDQVRKVLNEYEETNTHKLEAKDEHTVGLYRWVNKVYKAKVVNYGKRLMMEFMVPEPGAFHLFAMTEESVENTVKVEKPVDPRSDEAVTAYGVPSPLRQATNLNNSNYGLWGAIYGAKLEPPPAAQLTIAKAYHREGMDHNVQFADSKNDLKLPGGYEADSFAMNYGIHSEDHDGGSNWITVIAGRWSKFTTGGASFSHTLDGEDDFVPFVAMGRTRFYALNIEVTCRLTPAHYAEWQIKTYDTIIKAYQERLQAYEIAFAEAKARAGVQIRGTNPLRNREIEMMELKKGAIRLMTRCKPVYSTAMQDADPADPCSVPDFECCDAIRDGSFVQFVEQAFEWKLITYLFYPYFWGRKCNWSKVYQLDDVDTLFLNFLQAGYAKVMVPVRLGYEDSVLRFLADGTIWNGGSAPGVDSDMYLAIANEMKEPVGEIDPEVEPWLITVPTTLTVLQCESGCVDGNGLPCPCEDEPAPPPP